MISLFRVLLTVLTLYYTVPTNNLQVGAQGMTATVVAAAADMLAKHELIRVRLGDGCGLERKAAAVQLEELLDCMVVHQIGFTITLYRQRGLPRTHTSGGSGNAVGGSAVEGSSDSAGVDHNKEVATGTMGGATQAQQQAGPRKRHQRPHRQPRPPPGDDAPPSPPAVHVL